MNWIIAVGIAFFHTLAAVSTAAMGNWIAFMWVGIASIYATAALLVQRSLLSSLSDH